VLAQVNLGDGWKDLTVPAGTYSDEQLNAHVRAQTGGLVGIQTEAERVAQEQARAELEAQARAEYEAATRPQRPGRQIPFCELHDPGCEKRPTRKGLVPWSDDPEIDRPHHEWMCFTCWQRERRYNYPGCDD
jgi:hypothetical protein